VDCPSFVAANDVETYPEVGNSEVEAGAIGGENVGGATCYVDSSCTVAGSGAPVVCPPFVAASVVETYPEVGNSEVKAGAVGGENVDEATCYAVSSCTVVGSGAPVDGPSFVAANVAETFPEVGNSEGKAGFLRESCASPGDAEVGSCAGGSENAIDTPLNGAAGTLEEVVESSVGDALPVTHYFGVLGGVSGRSYPPVSAVKLGGNFPGEILEFGFAAEVTIGERKRRVSKLVEKRVAMRSGGDVVAVGPRFHEPG
jgi:hypothetical protein